MEMLLAADGCCFPDITLADGGGCIIQRIPPFWNGWLLTTGGCRSLTGGLRDT
jgi:hypothetical protein